MTAHKHAALMAQYAQDAAETDKPWERWELRFVSAGGCCGSGLWRELDGSPLWSTDCEYRRKPQQTRYLIDIPEPLMQAPKDGQMCYLADPTAPERFLTISWVESSLPHERWFLRGLVFNNKEDAVFASRAMCPFKGTI